MLKFHWSSPQNTSRLIFSCQWWKTASVSGLQKQIYLLAMVTIYQPIHMHPTNLTTSRFSLRHDIFHLKNLWKHPSNQQSCQHSQAWHKKLHGHLQPCFQPVESYAALAVSDGWTVGNQWIPGRLVNCWRNGPTKEIFRLYVCFRSCSDVSEKRTKVTK